MLYNLDINNRAFKAIKSGTKTVEIRANKNNGNTVSLLEAGDEILFINNSTGEIHQVFVERKTLYETVRDLLEAEGPENALSSTNDLEEGIESVLAIPGYKDYIEKNGVFAIKIQVLTNK